MMRLNEKAKELQARVRALEADEALREERKLPSDCWFLDDNTVLAYKRKVGDGRYPYANDGLTLWAYSSGNISVQESLFNVFLDAREGKEPYLCFFAGEGDGEGYFPVSLLGVARQPVERGVKRYTVFTPEAVYYFTETEKLFAVVRAFVDRKKRICFSTYLENTSSAPLQSYVSAYLNPFMRHAEAEDFETKWYKSCTRTQDGFDLKVTEYISRESCLTHFARLLLASGEGLQTTTSRFEFTGGMNECLNCASALFAGEFAQGKGYTGFTDMAVAATMRRVTLQPGEGVREDYIFAVSDNEQALDAAFDADMGASFALDEAIFAAEEASKRSEGDALQTRFGGLEGSLVGRDVAFNAFLRNVVRQTEFCARAKNYAGPFIGIRDIFQQVEAAIVWIPQYCRGKIVEALNFIGDNGRPPRQYSYPANAWTPPKMDLRAFIDQGVWIISTVFTYLCYTDDWSILDEICGYYHFEGDSVQLCNRKDSVLEHLLLIADYLVSNLDEETGCLKALYGDWNDALDGLGKTKKAGCQFGNGVSVMASLQLYRNLWELSQILRKVGKYADKAAGYESVRARLGESLCKHAVTGQGTERKILHGWGDDRSWFVGSYQDNDGFSRDGLTASAYWILSGMHEVHADLLPDILKAYGRLDSKYGYKTFEPYFSQENDKVGRINRLPKGTAENGATYIHATLFAIWSLFEIGEAKLAWEQIYKILPITHSFISTTPFVMPNSYVHNEEKGFDGESMNDWFTGSGCVLLKVLFGGIFGVKPTLDGVNIKMNAYMPAANAQINLSIKGCAIALRYQKDGGGRRYFVNKTQVEENGDGGIFLPTQQLQQGTLLVEIFD